MGIFFYIYIFLSIFVISGCSDTSKKSESSPEPSSFRENQKSMETGIPTNMSIVKNTIFPNLSSQYTLGKALDNWQGCVNPTWKEKIGDRNEPLIVFGCDLVNPVVNADKSPIMDNISKVQYSIIFGIDQINQSAQVNEVAFIFTFYDNKSFISMSDRFSSYFGIRSAYQNEINVVVPNLTEDDYNARQ